MLSALALNRSKGGADLPPVDYDYRLVNMRITPLVRKKRKACNETRSSLPSLPFKGKERCSDHTTLEWAIRWYQVMFEVFSMIPRFVV